MPCCNCTGPAHPATGHQLSPNLLMCHRCAGRYLAWVVRHTRAKAKRGSKERGLGHLSFYDAAATSIRPA